MKALTVEQIEARMNVYDDLIDHLDCSIYENETERAQGVIMKAQLKRLAKDFYDRHEHKIPNDPDTV